jgi:esterase/lipase superfamily enzyme
VSVVAIPSSARPLAFACVLLLSVSQAQGQAIQQAPTSELFPSNEAIPQGGIREFHRPGRQWCIHPVRLDSLLAERTPSERSAVDTLILAARLPYDGVDDDQQWSYLKARPSTLKIVQQLESDEKGFDWLFTRLCAAYQGGELSRFQVEAAVVYLLPAIWDYAEPNLEATGAAVAYITVKVFYGTSRRRTSGDDSVWYGNSSTDSLALGQARVNIPSDRRLRPPGQLDAGGWRWLRVLPVTARPDIVLDTVMPLTQSKWVEAIRADLQANSARSLLVYVHGFNTTFKEAARRTAQLVWDLPFKGTATMYSWPSLGSGTVGAYRTDRRTMEKSVRHLEKFLELTVDQSRAQSVHLLAHSMGCDLVARAVKELAATRPDVRFDQVILAAPDIDADSLITTFGPPLHQATRGRLTLYASSHDKALGTSKILQSRRRAGQAGPLILVLSWLDTIDASDVPDDFTGHGYYARTATMLNDMQTLIVNGIPPDRRRLDRHMKGGLPYWALLPPDRR